MPAPKKRTKIPKATDAEVVFKSDMKCCVCKKKGDHIHHLDGKPDNNKFENLALLCFEHHELASIKGNIGKKLKKEAIVKYRNQHYQEIENARKRALGVFDNPIKNNFSEELLLSTTKTAIILVELDKIKNKYFGAEWEERSDILHEISIYHDHMTHRLSFAVLDFLELASSQTRAGLTESVAIAIDSLVLTYCHPFDNSKPKQKKQSIELGKLGIRIGENIAYDSFIHLRDLNLAMWGLTIIKYVYREAKREGIKELVEEVKNVYKGLGNTLKRPERDDLGNAQQMLKEFYADLDVWDLAFPVLSPPLMKIIESKK